MEREREREGGRGGAGRERVTKTNRQTGGQTDRKADRQRQKVEYE